MKARGRRPGEAAVVGRRQDGDGVGQVQGGFERVAGWLGLSADDISG
jgi:hypothetical protein